VAQKLGIKKIYTIDSTSNDPEIIPFQNLLKKGKSPSPVKLNPNDVCVLPYSSGTTGLPKGVMLSHKNIVANILQIYEHDKTSNDNSHVGLLPFFHIYGMTVVLLYSIFVRIPTYVMESFDLVKFLTLVSKNKITNLHLVPPVCVALAKHPIVDQFDLKHVRFILSGAAPLGPDIEEALSKRLGVVVRQGYGMTELSPVSHISPLTDMKRGSIGFLLPNQEQKVIHIDGSGKMLGPNEEGELCIRGPNVMVGYLNNETATKNMIDKDGWLKTGDIVKIDDDGYCFVLDRMKELIKFKGLQVAPAELEAFLLSHSAIQDAAVVGKKDDYAGELPTAFVVIKDKHKLTEDEIHDFINQKVASHKRLRGGIHFVSSIPKTASGKILRRVLRDQINAK